MIRIIMMLMRHTVWYDIGKHVC